MSVDSRCRWVIASTFLVAFVLSILPMPAWADQFRPNWVALVLIYWCLAAPGRVAVGTGWIVGFILDILYGSLLGQHALACAVIAYLAVRFHLQIRMFPRWQQAVTVLVLLLIGQALVLWIKGLMDQAPNFWTYWTSSVVGMMIWPWLFVILRDIRRRGNVT